MSVYQDFLDEKIRQGVAPGLSAIIYDCSGLVFNGTSGMRTIEQDGIPAKPMKDVTIHWFASATKIAVSVVILSLLERGAIEGISLGSLDDHEALIRYLPEFQIGSKSLVSKILTGFGPVGHDGKQELLVQQAKSKITLRHLFTHSAGLAYEWTHPLITELYRPKEGSPHFDLLMQTGAIHDFSLPRIREAGEEMCYSPAGDWLGQLAVRGTGKNLRSLFHEIITQPLGINKSEIDIARTRLPKDAERASVYVRSSEGEAASKYSAIQVESYSPEDDEPPEGHAHFAGAGINDTVQAFGQILQACMNRDPRLLKQSTWELVERDAWNGTLKMPNPLWKSNMADLTFDIDVFAPSPKGSKGFGMNLLQQHVAIEKTDSGRSAGSYTWAGLCNSYYCVDPITQLSSMISTQLIPFADPQLMTMKEEREALIYSQQQQPH